MWKLSPGSVEFLREENERRESRLVLTLHAFLASLYKPVCSTVTGFISPADSPMASSMYFLSSGVMVGWAAGLSYDTRIQNKYQQIPKLPTDREKPQETDSEWPEHHTTSETDEMSVMHVLLERVRAGFPHRIHRRLRTSLSTEPDSS